MYRSKRKKRHLREYASQILIATCCFFFLSFLPFHLRLSKLLQHCASFPLLSTDNELLHSSADSSSPKATLIVLKHTAPVKLIIVLDCCHFVPGPVTQRVRGFSAQPASCPLSPTHTTFQIIQCVKMFFFLLTEIFN